jgi:hypothetical protein
VAFHLTLDGSGLFHLTLAWTEFHFTLALVEVAVAREWLIVAAASAAAAVATAMRVLRGRYTAHSPHVSGAEAMVPTLIVSLECHSWDIADWRYVA